MNSLNSIVKVFSNFKEFYSEINGATLTGAIDVIVVEQPDGSYLCSPFHVRFGKLGVLRSREKVVDIEVNGEQVDIHMKLGESGEAFFVEECPEDDLDILPDHMATSPIPTSSFHGEYQKEISTATTASNTDQLQLPRPRRNSIDLTTSTPAGECSECDSLKPTLENQVSDYTHRRYTDNFIQRPNLTAQKIGYTTQQLRAEWAAEQDKIKAEEMVVLGEAAPAPAIDEDKHFRPIDVEQQTSEAPKALAAPVDTPEERSSDSKSKKKRRKKSAAMKKKNAQRKNSTSSGSTHSDPNEIDPENASNKTLSSAESTPNDATPATPSKPIDEPHVDTPSRILDMHFFSDTEMQSQSPRPGSPIQSDTEFEVSQRGDKNASVMENSASWKWGEFPTQGDGEPGTGGATPADDKEAARKSMLSGMFSLLRQGRKMRNKQAQEGLYLSDLEADCMDPEVAALYFPASYKEGRDGGRGREEDRESGNGTSVPQSPTSMEGVKSLDSDYDDKPAPKELELAALSLCGGIDKGGPTKEEFEKHKVSYSDICRDPAIFSSPNLVVQLFDKYYSWQIACPIVMTMLVFQKNLTKDICEKIEASISKPVSDAAASSSDDQTKPTTEPQDSSRRSWWYWRRSGGGSAVDTKQKAAKDAIADSVATQTSRSNSPEDVSLRQLSEKYKTANDSYNASQSSADSVNGSPRNSAMPIAEKYRKTLRLSSSQIESLGLRSGMNEVEFSVTTAYQGTTRCRCYIFKWRWDDKVVISDIDGTITRSDVLGHILPMVGKDWAQIGVAQLFSKIEENGYKLLYLSARAIGQSRLTREYLQSIRQGDVKLPDGPLLLNPTSLISAFHREVIEKKPEQFKIACLSDIQALFPDKNPFYAGYGNRINDVWAYRAVGIPIMRIFTINTKGELKHELTQTFQSTYAGQSLVCDEIFPPLPKRFEEVEDEEDAASNASDDGCWCDDCQLSDDDQDQLQFGVELEDYASMAYIVDQLFPPIEQDHDEDIEYTSFNYWRDPVPELADLELDQTLNSSTSSSANASATAAQKSLPTIPENTKA